MDVRFYLAFSESLSKKRNNVQYRIGKNEKAIIELLQKKPSSLKEIEAYLTKNFHELPVGKHRNEMARVLFEMEEKGVLRIEFPGDCSLSKEIHEGIQCPEKACRNNPGFWNIIAYEVEWTQYGEYFDYLNPAAPNHDLKKFECAIYMKQIQEYLEKGVPRGGRVLDAGGGIGRFSAELLRCGYEVILVDASERALKLALKSFEQQGAKDYSLFHLDVNDLSIFPDNHFDAIFAIELLCYCSKPEQVLRELIRVCVPGGWLFFSVEGKYGSLLTDSKIGLYHFHSVYDGNLLARKNDVYVQYFTAEEFREFLGLQGLHVLEIEGSHYVPDGILHRYIEEAGAPSGEVENVLMEIEEACRKDPVLGPLARAWTAICRKTPEQNDLTIDS